MLNIFSTLYTLFLTTVIYQLYIFLGEMSLHILHPFSNWILFWLLNFESIWYIPDTSPLSNRWFANNLSQFVAYFFILLTDTFAVWKFSFMRLYILFLHGVLAVFFFWHSFSRGKGECHFITTEWRWKSRYSTQSSLTPWGGQGPWYCLRG